ncbi:MAG: hypothetical protein K5872_22350 [Rhizobiaceae bacterium]|nr:hypothetical protein [Rhizobiaceae bacterium]MCV0408963.1 hypothetical protein [Rhizobiaceae bacterium]
MAALHFADFNLWVAAIAVALTLAGGAVSGHRLHQWLFLHAPHIGRSLPADAGAWIGLAVSAAMLATGCVL